MKYLMRNGMDFFRDKSVDDIIASNKIGGNSGNTLFSSAIARAIMTDEDTEIKFLSTLNPFWFDGDVKKFNKNYDCFIIPLANAFRDNFMHELDALTSLVNKLKMPCIVIGVGLQNKFNGSGFEFDSNVKAFMDAVLKKSEMVGIRGRNTADYLTFLGYTEHKDFEIIGCPSMFYFGGELPKIEKKPLDKSSRVNITLKYALPAKYHLLVKNLSSEFENYNYTIQNIDEIRLQYVGTALGGHKLNDIENADYYPRNKNDESCRRVRCFVDFMSWRKFLQSEVDISVGNRIHGNISALLAGKPCYIVACDSRVKELAEYHKIPHCTIDELDVNKSLVDYYNEADYEAMYENHKVCFEKYLAFLHKNGIKTIFDDCPNPENPAFDVKFSSLPELEGIVSFSNLTPEQYTERLEGYIKAQNRNLKRNTKHIDNVQGKYIAAKDYEKKYKKLRSGLDNNFFYRIYRKLKKFFR